MGNWTLITLSLLKPEKSIPHVYNSVTLPPQGEVWCSSFLLLWNFIFNNIVPPSVLHVSPVNSLTFGRSGHNPVSSTSQWGVEKQSILITDILSSSACRCYRAPGKLLLDHPLQFGEISARMLSVPQGTFDSHLATSIG